jgi:transposase
MRRRDELGPLVTDTAVTPLFAVCGRPAEAPWRLALVTIRPYVDGLSDRQAVHAMRRRTDWKFTVRLELTDPGFDSTAVSGFLMRLMYGRAEQSLLDG